MPAAEGSLPKGHGAWSRRHNDELLQAFYRAVIEWARGQDTMKVLVPQSSVIGKEVVKCASSGCGRPAADGYAHCCRTCMRSTGEVRQHGRLCEAHGNAELQELARKAEQVLRHMHPQQRVYVQRVVPDGATEDCCDFSVGKASMNVPEGIVCCAEQIADIDFLVDGFPGASIMYPAGNEQWQPQLAVWMLGAGLRVGSLMSVATFIADILVEEASVDSVEQGQPLTIRHVFIAFAAAAFALELLLAIRRTREAVKNMCDCKRPWFVAGSLMLRFFTAPHMLLSATQNAHEALNRDLQNSKIPVVINVSRFAWRYEKVSGFYAMLPKVLMEDFVMTLMKGWLTHSEVTTMRWPASLWFMLVFAAFSLAINMKNARDYFAAILDYDQELFVHMQSFGDPFDMKGRRNNLNFEWLRNQLLDKPCMRRLFGCRFLSLPTGYGTSSGVYQRLHDQSGA